MEHYTLEEFRDWMDDEGGYLGLWRHGVEEHQVPLEIKSQWDQLDVLFTEADKIMLKISEKIGY